MESVYRQNQIFKAIDGILSRVFTVKPFIPALDSVLYKSLSDKQQESSLRKLERLRQIPQYLYFSDPKNSHESELIAWSTVVSDPVFAIEGAGLNDLVGSRGDPIPLSDLLLLDPETPYWLRRRVTLHPTPDGVMEKSDNKGQFPCLWGTDEPLPPPPAGMTPLRVTYHVVHSLHALRAVLLVLIDSSNLCAKDPDFVGNLPAQDSLWALHKMRSWSEETFVSNVKYWKDWPLATFLKNDRPPVPSSWHFSDTDPLFAGGTGQYFRRLAHFDSSRADASPVYRAVFGLAQSKRGFAAVPDSFVLEAYRKHAKQLSSPPPEEVAFDTALARQFIRTIFKGFSFPDTFQQLVRQEASTSASVYTNRSEGGTRASVRSEIATLFGTGARILHRSPVDRPYERPDEEDEAKYLAELTSRQNGQVDANPVEPYNVEKHFFLGFREVMPGQVIEDRGTYQISADEWRLVAQEFINQKPSFARLPSRYHDQFRDKFQPNPETSQRDLRWSPNELRWKNFARVAAVLEPAKVRIITAMDPVLSHISKPFQNALWQHLRSFPVFSLIGEPVNESLLHDLNIRFRQQAPSLGLDRDKASFVSGDYSAATDGLDIRLSKLFLETILDGLPEEDAVLRDVYRSVLLEQVILYPDSRVEPVIQQNGQLMGSVLSFPFLCLANLFAYIMALGRGDRDKQHRLVSNLRTIARLPVLINGDDILFRSDGDLYQHWLGEIAKVGFKPSVGKNFIHPRFFTVNSVPIEFRPAPTTNEEFWDKMSWADMAELPEGFPSYRPDSITDTFNIHGYLNVGLLTGQAKLTGREVLRNLPLSGWHAQSVITALNPAQAHRWFLHYHLESIQRQTRFGGTTLNLFAHPLKGGLGFIVPPGVHPGFSPEQRRLAEALHLSASASFQGRERDFDLSPLVSVVTPSTGAPLAGTKNHRSEIYLYPANTPLLPGLESLVNRTQVSSIPLSQTYGVLPEDDSSTVECRLSGSRIRSLIKRWGKETVPLHPVEHMLTFPFIVVRDSRPDRRSGPLRECDYITYSPEVPFQDVPTSVDILTTELPFGGDESLGTIPPSAGPTPVSSPVDDWDRPQTILFPVASSSRAEEEFVDIDHPINVGSVRGNAGRKRRRLQRALPDVVNRPWTHQY